MGGLPYVSVFGADYPTPDNFLYPLLSKASIGLDNRGRYDNPAFDAELAKEGEGLTWERDFASWSGLPLTFHCSPLAGRNCAMSNAPEHSLTALVSKPRSAEPSQRRRRIVSRPPGMSRLFCASPLAVFSSTTGK